MLLYFLIWCSRSTSFLARDAIASTAKPYPNRVLYTALALLSAYRVGTRHSAPTQTIDDIMHGHNDAIALPKKHINIFRYRRKLNELAYSLFIQVVASQLCTLWCSIENCSNISKQYYRLQYVSINIY